MASNLPLLIRKSHRFLGLFIGIQFLAWTVSGLYFAWSDIDEVHGDFTRKAPQGLSTGIEVVSPSVAVSELQASKQVDSVSMVTLISVVGLPLYQITYYSGHVGEGSHLHTHVALADAVTGKIRNPLNREEAIALAKDNIVAGAEITNVALLTKTDGHHEYRERPLPAWAISFENPNCTAYISAERGTFQAVRNDNWRVFDFLWMGHTMDYKSRDNINNLLLRIFSVFGLITVISGFILFVFSTKTFIKWNR